MKEKILLQSSRSVPFRTTAMIVLCGWLFCAAAQNVPPARDGFIVTGTVADTSGEPLAGVNIIQKNAAATGR
jgi:hypothetical protein